MSDGPTEMIRVINHNPEPLKGRFDGEDFVFPPEKPVDLPFAAAKHIFGLGEEDKSQALNMLGWLVPGKDTLDDAMKKLDQITFLNGVTVFPEDDAADEEETEGARPRRRTGGRPHVTGASGESGAAPQGAAPANSA